MRLCIVTTLRASCQETIDFVNYHLNIGVDHMYLFFDNPTDVAMLHVDSTKTTCISCNKDHWDFVGCSATDNIEVRQRSNANLALEWARKDNFTWISHIDSDEFIYSVIAIKKLLSKLSNEVIYLRLPSKEAVPEQLNYTKPYREITLFKSLPSWEYQFYQGKHHSAFFDNEYFRGHIVGKSIVRVSHHVRTLSLHAPELMNGDDPSSVVLEGASLLHFDCYDIDSWQLKWERRLNGIARSGGRENRMKQKAYFKKYQELENKDERVEAYVAMHFIDPSIIDDLVKDKMLESIRLEKELFDSNFSSFSHLLKKIMTKLKI